MHVFREGDKARVLEVGPGCFRLLPFNDTRESFWVWSLERLKREKEELLDCFHTFKIEGGNSRKHALLFPCSNNSCLSVSGSIYSVAQSLQT